MKTLTAYVLFVATGTVVAGGHPSAAGASNDVPKPKPLACLDTPWDAARMVQALVRRTDANREKALSKLRYHDDPSIALYSEYCYHLGTNGDKLTESERIQRVLGFLEAYAPCEAPAWWVNALRDGKHPSAFSYIDRVPTHRIDNSFSTDFPPAPRAAKDGMIIDRADSTAVLLKTAQIDTLAAGSPSLPNRVGTLVDRNLLYVALYSDTGNPFILAAIDHADDEKKWTAIVWASGYVGVRGRSRNCLSLAETKSAIVVYGCSYISLYCEAFDKSTGAALFRFSSSLWSLGGDH